MCQISGKYVFVKPFCLKFTLQFKQNRISNRTTRRWCPFRTCPPTRGRWTVACSVLPPNSNKSTSSRPAPLATSTSGSTRSTSTPTTCPPPSATTTRWRGWEGRSSTCRSWRTRTRWRRRRRAACRPKFRVLEGSTRFGAWKREWLKKSFFVLFQTFVIWVLVFFFIHRSVQFYINFFF